MGIYSTKCILILGLNRDNLWTEWIICHNQAQSTNVKYTEFFSKEIKNWILISDK